MDDRIAGLLASKRELAERIVGSGEGWISGLSDEELSMLVTLGYLVRLHVVMVSEALALARVANRVGVGGHAVPEEKVRERYLRLWPLVASAIGLVDTASVYDNSRAAHPFRVVASFEHGSVVGEPAWPAWTPGALRNAG